MRPATPGQGEEKQQTVGDKSGNSDNQMIKVKRRVV